MLYDADGNAIKNKGTVEFDSLLKSTLEKYGKVQAEMFRRQPTIDEVFGKNIYDDRGRVVANTGAKIVSGANIRIPYETRRTNG